MRHITQPRLVWASAVDHRDNAVSITEQQSGNNDQRMDRLDGDTAQAAAAWLPGRRRRRRRWWFLQQQLPTEQ